MLHVTVDKVMFRRAHTATVSARGATAIGGGVKRAPLVPRLHATPYSQSTSPHVTAAALLQSSSLSAAPLVASSSSHPTRPLSARRGIVACSAVLSSSSAPVASLDIADGTGVAVVAAASAASPASAATTFTRMSNGARAAALLVSGAVLGGCVVSDDMPALRLFLLTYALWAMGEWVVHRFFMHARAGSMGDRVSHINRLHVEHHKDTYKDMAMKEGFDVDALYFHFPNTVIQVLFGTAVLASADVALSLDIPYAWTLASSIAFAATHNLLWNTLHMDMHGVSGDKMENGMPCVQYKQYSGIRGYARWVFENHTTHHDVGGGSNYNVVCPGPDFLMGTYMHRSQGAK